MPASSTALNWSQAVPPRLAVVGAGLMGAQIAVVLARAGIVAASSASRRQ
jgi:pyruvate/2-oxoglutarate dehydrogenase complex dihydrolipoamide dehydrogenase (E3) component